MQKIRDRIKNLMLSGRGKMVDPKYNDLKKQIILHCKPEEKEQIMHQVERLETGDMTASSESLVSMRRQSEMYSKIILFKSQRHHCGSQL